MALTIGSAGHGQSLVLQNDQISLRFDATTGEWIGLLDKRSGRELVTAPVAGAPIDTLSWLDPSKIEAAIRNRKALSIEGTWQYAPEVHTALDRDSGMPVDKETTWAPTPVPSQADQGDLRLKDRVGAFWYYTQIKIPPAWKGKDLVLIIGAVDDFDTTYLNGEQIGATLEGTPHHWEIPRRYAIPARLLRFESPNTVAIRVVNAAFSGGIAGPVCVGLAEELPAPKSSVRLVSHQLSAEGSTLRMDLKSGAYLVRAAYTLSAGKPLISRRLTIENASAVRQVVRDTPYALPGISVGSDQAIICPDSLPVGDQPLEQMASGGVVRPTSQDGLVYLWSPKNQCGLGAWLDDEDEYAPASVARTERGARVIHHVGVLAPLEPGAHVELGAQFIWLAHGSRDTVLRSVGDVFSIIKLAAPGNSLDHLRQHVLYCGHPGGMPEQQYRGYGGFKALQSYLPTLKKMGVDLLWMLPIFEHGDGIRWNLYSPFDHFQVSPLYGTEQELKALSAAAKEAGIGLMFDLVPHGPPEHTPLGKEHPDWVCLDEAGKPTHVWGQLAFDNALPAWQDYMLRAAEHHAREFGVVGARVDVAAGSPPNWNPKAGYRPSHSGLGGGLGMDHAIREGLLKANRGVLLLPEEYTGCRLFYRDGDLTYDAQLFFLMVDLQAKKATPEQWASTLQRFLHDQSLTLPPGAVKMRWTANHDTVSWTFQKKRTREAYGFERSRALLALCCLIDGVPMIYQGEEDPSLYGGKGPSMVDDIGRFVDCRKRLAALSQGSADYQSVQASGGVFACLRTERSQSALVLVSMNPQPVESRLSVPAPLRATEKWKDELTLEEFSLPVISMGNHQVRVLTPAR